MESWNGRTVGRWGEKGKSKINDGLQMAGEQENDGVVRVSTSKAKTHALRSNKVATLMQVEYILYNDND